MKILIDADALVALAKEDDRNHPKAEKIAGRLKKASLYVTPFTIAEAATVLSYKVSQKAAREFLLSARERKLIEVKITAPIARLADEIFVKQTRKGISWIDCLNVALVRYFAFDAIFSFDKFYRQLGLQCLGR